MRTRKAGNLAPAGSTGNNTHASVALPADADVAIVEFEVTAVGGTPTITYNVQASMDGPEVPDASSDWLEPFALRENAAAETDVGGTMTAVGLQSWTLELARRPFRKVRLVVSANTNVTYESELYVGLID